jgi:beta-lactam-binding protein with PASTA domain
MSFLSQKIRLTPTEKKLTQRALKILGTFTAIMAFTGLAAMLYTQRHQPLVVPKIIGMDQAQAEKLLSSKNLVLKVSRSVFDEHVPVGLISDQLPKANNYVKHGQTIEVVLSKGNPKVKIPNVLHMSLPQAQMALAGAHLRVGKESLVNTIIDPKDTVVAQSPETDELVDSFTDVNLLVSAGPTDPAFVMPELKNKPLEMAFKSLRPAGITIDKIKSETHDDLDSETVLSQTPPAGTKIQKKDSVSFVVSSKSSDASLKARYTKIQFDMPEGNPRRLQIDVLDSSGTRTIHNKMESPKDHIEVGVSITGKASAQIYLNQEFVKEIPIE